MLCTLRLSTRRESVQRPHGPQLGQHQHRGQVRVTVLSGLVRLGPHLDGRMAMNPHHSKAEVWPSPGGLQGGCRVKRVPAEDGKGPQTM